MKYFVISDIHGSSLALGKALSHFEKERCDFLFILGDILYHGPRNPLPGGHDPNGAAEMLNRYYEKIIAVRGNCDAEVDQLLLNFPCMHDYALVVDEGRRLFLTHGHVYNEFGLPYSLPAGSVLFSGHTHIARMEKKDGLIYVNPGSISLPKPSKDESLPASYAIYESSGGKAVIKLNSLENGGKLKELVL